MITHELAGGLGNQLFQIVTTIALAIRTNQSFFFVYSTKLGQGETTIRPTYWNTLFKDLKKFTVNETVASIYMKGKLFYIREINHNYNQISLHNLGEIDLFILSGYFQSYKYFAFEFQNISKMIGFERQVENTLNSNPTVGDMIRNDNSSISLHFRLGDYKHLKDWHPIMPFEYFKKSLEYIVFNSDQHHNVYYFCEKEDLIYVEGVIKELKKYLRFNFYHIPSDISDWEQLLLMSSCKHNIIANSSFSLWAAFLNISKNKIVCYPSHWVTHKMNVNTSDMFPGNWIKIDVN